jgi:FtsP/CotA-like multicopper oxidase with cupredoxin domain/peroxiredoxin
MHALLRTRTRLALLPGLLLAIVPLASRGQGVEPAKPASQDPAKSAQSRAMRDDALSRKLSAEAFLREAEGARVTDAAVLPVTRPANLSVDAERRVIQPLALRSQDGSLDVELVLDYGLYKIGNDLVRLRTYNGSLVGPTLRVKAGDTLFLLLRNKLPVEPDSEHVRNTYHNWNTTNLHFHGLHVAPQGTPELESDNVLLKLKPVYDPRGSVQRYAVKIPIDHPAGTFWYHAHVHGSTTPQVASGVAGALIVDRDDSTTNLDDNPAVREATKAEAIFVLQEIPYLMDNQRGYGEIENVGTNSNTMFDPGQWKILKRYITVNGQKIPTLRMAPGEVRRFRFIAAEQREIINLQIQKTPEATGPNVLNLYEIALDGLPTGDIATKTNLELNPGYRSDVLVQAPTGASGEYDLVDLNAAAGSGADGSPEPLKLVARILISGTPRTMDLPKAADLAKYRLPDPAAPTAPTEYAFYGIVTGGPNGVSYFITRKNVPPGQVPDGQEFDPTDVRKLTLGKTQQWVVGSRNTPPISVAHPFHIHINPFLIQKVQDEQGADVTTREIGRPTWRDTLAMKQGYSYTLITKYDRYAGTFVDHCHILDHEDHGMMELVSIVDPGAPAAARAAVLESPAKLPVADLAKPTVVLFVKGSFCPHCMTQLNDMGNALGSSLANVVVVSAAGTDDLGDFPRGPFALVADPKHTLFREYGAFRDEPLHATIVLNPAGKTLLKEVGDTPFMDVEAVRRSIGAVNAAATLRRLDP